jgi:hypothetical protein
MNSEKPESQVYISNLISDLYVVLENYGLLDFLVCQGKGLKEVVSFKINGLALQLNTNRNYKKKVVQNDRY